ncbi:ABC transporter ATP-binding protein [Psychrobacillus sp. NPDC093200]|uniref:ABC transporter ATP-binding protein n=1 Tax=Psychrobacillus sp. NPDC093200 TaxID=3390656 RepID=UPI003CFEE07E
MLYLQATNLVKKYGNRDVVKDINMNISQNEILGVIGPNGAGKTTCIELLIGLKEEDGGTIQYFMEDFKNNIGVQLQSISFFPRLSVSENLRLFGAFYKKNVNKYEMKEILSKCNLTQSANMEASKLSGGQQKRLAIALTLIHDPKLIFLDEPTAALDPLSKKELHSLIRQVNKEGRTVVFTSHDMEEVNYLANRIIFINKGRIICEGDPKLLIEEHNVANLESLYIKLISEEVSEC